MGKLLAYILPGIIICIALIFFSFNCVSEETSKAIWFNNLMRAGYILSIVIPCVIYYIKTPPGKMNKPD
ncbi:MAG: hypothetical protein MJZ26_06880 [Fibrobacter sp.]|nr:hypothetical protein [Fibrobacter sp.]